MKNKNHKLLQLSAFVLIVSMVTMVACQKNAELSSGPVNTSNGGMYALGCQMLPANEYARIPMAVMPDVYRKTLPAVVNLTVPPVSNQGTEGSCVAFGTTYAARSINWKYRSTATASFSNSVNVFSPEYVYNQIKVSSSCGSGSYVVYGLNLLKSKGACTWSVMPYVNGACSVVPSATQNTAAASYKISGYSTVSIDSTTIKNFLATNKPVIVAGPVNVAFENLANGGVLTTFTGASLGGHCYCVVGYDDSKHAFKFMNSWGTSWATAGFGYISYRNIASWWTEAYVIN